MVTENDLIEILLVDDNPGDVELTCEAFLECKVTNRIHVAEDGEEALDFLYRKGKFHDAVRPDVILLDLNMPGKDGKEVLTEIKYDEDLSKIPVIILTGTETDRDSHLGDQLHANHYIIKPVSLEKFLGVIRDIEPFWLTVVRPSNPLTPCTDKP